MRAIVTEAKKNNQTIGLVPTMGYLHQGHLSLMEKARENCAVLITSIFVNPLQFGVGEDYEEYPRDLTKDSILAEEVGVDYIFAPIVDDMYPKGHLTFVETEKITQMMCGNSRPGHFTGVTTVVTKLFNIVQPDEAYFGEKDAQQLIIIKKMVQDLNIPVQVIGLPIVREADGLAMSSRNVYLNAEERSQAVVLNKSLKKAEQLLNEGVRNLTEIKVAIESTLAQAPLAQIDYVEIRNGEDLSPLEEVFTGKILIALAVKFGDTRLIDNMIVEV